MKSTRFLSVFIGLIFVPSLFAQATPKEVCGNGTNPNVDCGTRTPYTSSAGWSAIFRLGTEKGVLSRLEFSTDEGRDISSNVVKTSTVKSYVSIDVDNYYTESVSYTDFNYKIDPNSLGNVLDRAAAAMAHKNADGTLDKSAKLRIDSRRTPVVQGHPGQAATVADDYTSNYYYETFAVGKRLYQLTVATAASEDADEPANYHRTEAERFFSSFKLAQIDRSRAQN